MEIDGMGKLPPGAEELLKMGGQFDPRNMPDMMRVEFREINWQWAIDESGTCHLVWSLAILPFIKFTIPFHVNGVRNLMTSCQRVLEQVEASTSTD